MNITQNTKEILENIYLYKNAKLALATKTHFKFKILQEALHCDKNIIIAENRIQEAEEKIEILNKFPHKKHFIGTLQSNKVKKAVQIFDCIETVDSIKLLQRINRIVKITKGEDFKFSVFLNINISEDKNKSGILSAEINNFISEIIKNIKNKQLENIKIQGLFTILKYDLSDSEKHEYYAKMKRLQIKLQQKIPSITELSMGMSQDYKIALSEGATIVRIGRGVFGDRKNY
jgi:pyridoxal phosphate enzyme (YggS family)